MSVNSRPEAGRHGRRPTSTAMVRAAEDAFGPRGRAREQRLPFVRWRRHLRHRGDTWDADVAGVLKSAFLCSKRVLPGMIERWAGVILNIASVNALAYFGNEAYKARRRPGCSTSRSRSPRDTERDGDPRQCRSLRARSAPRSGRNGSTAEPEIFDKLVKWYPLAASAKPEDVARAALFLASDESRDQRRRPPRRRRPDGRLPAHGRGAPRRVAGRRHLMGRPVPLRPGRVIGPA